MDFINYSSCIKWCYDQVEEAKEQWNKDHNIDYDKLPTWHKRRLAQAWKKIEDNCYECCKKRYYPGGE